MADNYIERQYEQYEARKAAWEKARKYGKKKTGITHPARTEQPGQTTTEPHHYKSLTVPLRTRKLFLAVYQLSI